MAQDQVVSQFSSAKIQRAMSEPELLGGELLAASPRNRNWRCLGGSNNADRTRANLDVTGGQVGIPLLGRPRRNFAADKNDALNRKRGRVGHDVGRSPTGVKRDLDDPGAVTQIHEDHSAQIANAVDPAAKIDRASLMLAPERTGQMRALCRREG
jgi:hypothetical protein